MEDQCYAAEWVENPELMEDLQKYFFYDLTEEVIVEMLQSNAKRKLAAHSAEVGHLIRRKSAGCSD